jgi:hypothetical protein
LCECSLLRPRMMDTAVPEPVGLRPRCPCCVVAGASQRVCTRGLRRGFRGATARLAKLRRLTFPHPTSVPSSQQALGIVAPALHRDRRRHTIIFATNTTARGVHPHRRRTPASPCPALAASRLPNCRASTAALPCWRQLASGWGPGRRMLRDALDSTAQQAGAYWAAKGAPRLVPLHTCHYARATHAARALLAASRSHSCLPGWRPRSWPLRCCINANRINQAAAALSHRDPRPAPPLRRAVHTPA